MRITSKTVVLSISLFLSLSLPPLVMAEENDPYENVNRKVFAFNEFMDKWLLKPVAKGYRFITPSFVDTGVSNFFDNLGEVRNLVNGGLQGDGNHALTSTGRLLVNSTVGLGGLFDVASEWGLEERKEDFGQTLAVWGVGDGPYIVLPFLGGGNLRDSFSRIPDVYLSPVTYVDDVPTRNSLRGCRPCSRPGTARHRDGHSDWQCRVVLLRAVSSPRRLPSSRPGTARHQGGHSDWQYGVVLILAVALPRCLPCSRPATSRCRGGHSDWQCGVE